MDAPKIEPVAAPKLPWTVPVVTRVPIVSHTHNGPGASSDGSGFDDTTTS
jgi:hypothetical protein